MYICMELREKYFICCKKRLLLLCIYVFMYNIIRSMNDYRIKQEKNNQFLIVYRWNQIKINGNMYVYTYLCIKYRWFSINSVIF